MKHGLSAVGEESDARQRGDSVANATARGMLRRRRALGLAVVAVALLVLGIGWLADGIASTPRAATTAVMSQQAGLSTVSLSIRPTPLRAHQSETFELRIVDVAGNPVAGARVMCSLSMPAMAMVMPDVVATLTAQPGIYDCDAQLADTGSWTLAVTLTPRTGEPAHASFSLSAA